MTKKTRLIIITVCAILFLIITPYIILFSLGYRVDFKNLKIVGTGGIYIKAYPKEVNITIDSNINDKTSVFSNSFFTQNLLPTNHSIVIKKDGYYDYQKNLVVKENEVTKLEHINLIKQNILFTLLENNIDYFYITPNGKNLLTAKIANQKINFQTLNLENQDKNNFYLDIQSKKITDLKWSADSSKALLNVEGNYFLLQPFLENPTITVLPILSGVKEIYFNPKNSEEILFIKNKNLYSNNKDLPIIKNIITYQINDTTITWLSYDGFLYNFDIKSLATNKITLKVFLIKTFASYKIITNSNETLLKENESLFLLNQKSLAFENFYGPVNDFKVSPDGQKILYYNDHEILYSYLNYANLNLLTQAGKISLNKFSQQISECYWLGDNYIIFKLEDKITISEIDNRGNINIISLPETLSLDSGTKTTIKNPQIFFNQQDKKLYILNQNNIFSSETLLP